MPGEGGIWLPGFERINNAKSGGGTMLANAEAKWTGHSTEGYSKNPAHQAAVHPNPPHCWATLPSHPYKPRWRGQIISLDRSAFALKHNPGDPETNKDGPVQVEIEGLSVNFDGLPDSDPFEITQEDLDWLADFVVAPMCSAVGVNIGQWVTTAPLPGGAMPRLTWQSWRDYGGLCMHRNAPGQTHTDAPLNLQYISTRLISGAAAPGVIPGGDMPAFQHRPPHPTTKEVLRITADGVLQTSWQTTPNGLFGPFAQIKGTLDPAGNARFEPGSCSVVAPSDINPSPTIFATQLGQPNRLMTYFFNYSTGKWEGPANAN